MSQSPHIKEAPVIAALSGMYAFRMLGLFLIYPVLAVYAEKLPGATPFLLGLTLGIYGLSQAVLQIPFGILSDHFGRKPLIIFGLLLMAAGSIVAANSTDIYGLIIGRALQGTGAISAVITALLADLLAPSSRSRAMAIVGLTIGMSFGFSLILSPALAAAVGLSGLFWIIAALAVLSLGVLIIFVPQPVKLKESMPQGQWRVVLRNSQLWYLNISAFFLHALLTTLFLWMPTHLSHVASNWYYQSGIYLILLMASYAIMMPILMYGERNYQQKRIVQGSTIGFACVMLYFAVVPETSLWLLLLGTLVFLIPFNLLEATLPSWVSRIAPSHARGAALGMYATIQFLGIFIGGAGTGFVLKYVSFSTVFLTLAFLMLIWFFIVCGLKQLTKQE